MGVRERARERASEGGREQGSKGAREEASKGVRERGSEQGRGPLLHRLSGLLLLVCVCVCPLKEGPPPMSRRGLRSSPSYIARDRGHLGLTRIDSD